MASKGRVLVFARARPPLAREAGEHDVVKMDGTAKKATIRVEEGDSLEKALSGAAFKFTERSFDFDGVFALDSEQRDVFEEVGKPVLKDCLLGYNGCIFAYGQTGACHTPILSLFQALTPDTPGSGKTHSLLNVGGGTDLSQAGLLPRVVAALYVHIAGDLKHVYTVEAAMLQIYNEQVDCLLRDDRANAQNLAVNATGNVGVVGLQWIACATPDDLLRAFQKGKANLIYAETQMNKSSSRSHAVFQVKIMKRERAAAAAGAGAGPQAFKATFGKLSIVDLAGSERIKRSGAEGDRFREATNINGSLLALGNVIQALAEKKKHVPYRDSKLTRILEDSIGGNCKTTLLVCVSPASESVSETLSTLEFASRAMRVECNAVVNEGSVMVDAAKLAADLAGDGLNAALMEKHRAMLDMERKLGAAVKARQAEDKSREEEAAKKKADDAKKEAASAALVDRWRRAAEDASAKQARAAEDHKRQVIDLERAAADAKEATEARAKISALENDKAALERRVKALEDQLREAKSSMARAAEAAAAGHDAQVSDLTAQLADHRRNAEVSARMASDVQAERDALRTALGAAEGAAASAAAATRLESARRAAAADESMAAMKKAHDEALNSELGRREAENERQVGALRTQMADLERTLMARAAEREGALAAEADAARAAEAAASEAEAAAMAAAAEAGVAAQAAAAVATEATANERAARAAAASDAARAARADGDAGIARAEAAAAARAAADAENRAATAETDAASLRGALAAARATGEAALDRAVREAALAADAAAATAAAEATELRMALAAARGDADRLAAQRTRRVAWAFTAARNLMQMRVDHAQAALAEYVSRFEARESRTDDVAAIASLEVTVTALQEEVTSARHEREMMCLELDNREKNDALFGPKPPPPQSMSRNLSRTPSSGMGAAAAAAMRRVASARPSSAARVKPAA